MFAKLKTAKGTFIVVTSKHVPALAAIYVRAYKTRGEMWTQKKAEALLTGYITKEPGLGIALVVDGTLVGGFFGLIKPWWDGNHVSETEVFIDPKMQGKRYGSALFKTFVKRAAKRYKVVVFEGVTFSQLPFPRNWYKRIGIRPDKKMIYITGKTGNILKKS